MTAPTIAFADARLRGLRSEDVQAIVDYATSPGFFEHIEAPERLKTSYAQADAMMFIDEANRETAPPTWAIEWQGRLVGTIRLRAAAWRDGEEIGFGLHPEARGRGLATSAIQAVMAWCRAEGRPLPWARCAMENIPSQRALRRAGFQLVAVDGAWGHWAQPEA